MRSTKNTFHISMKFAQHFALFGNCHFYSLTQLDIMAELRTGTDKNCPSCIINNFRPPMEVGDRTVRLFTGESVNMKSLAEKEEERENRHLISEGKYQIRHVSSMIPTARSILVTVAINASIFTWIFFLKSFWKVETDRQKTCVKVVITTDTSGCCMSGDWINNFKNLNLILSNFKSPS